MKRKVEIFSINDIELFKQKALHWANQHDVLCYLDSNGHDKNAYHKSLGMLAVGMENHLLQTQPYAAFKNLKEYYETEKDWLFGFLTYDIKNDTERLESHGIDGTKMPEIHFFKPFYVLEFKPDSVHIHSIQKEPKVVFEEVVNFEIAQENTGQKLPKLQARISEQEYIETVKKVKEHIQLGDIYEMNFCQEYYAEKVQINPLSVFEKLNKATRTPFACFYKLKNRYLICASPERFIQKTRNTLISQPIKGTAPRSKDINQDIINKNNLYNSPKDRSENVMIVDLVRNDLARSCKAGSVQVQELYGIYGFENVWQMISTVVGELREDIHFIDALKLAYPMGSMTGAPKIRAMQLIEKYEKSKRGLYSGTVGYITPIGDFDFNVVIRSLVYNALEEYLSFQVGGAIIYDSDPQGEYKECLLKGKNIFNLLK